MELSQDILDRLLFAFDGDRQHAADKYLIARHKLVKFFDWRGCASAEELADETIDRACKKISAGETIREPLTYLFGIAKNVLLENWKHQKKDRAMIVSDADPYSILSPERTDADHDSEEQRNRRLEALRICLNRLPQEAKILILNYYRQDKGQKIENRKKLSMNYGIPLNALRIRAHRIRTKLENCVKQRMNQNVSSRAPKYISTYDSINEGES